jgi:hypothetical protein
MLDQQAPLDDTVPHEEGHALHPRATHQQRQIVIVDEGESGCTDLQQPHGEASSAGARKVELDVGVECHGDLVARIALNEAARFRHACRHSPLATSNPGRI